MEFGKIFLRKTVGLNDDECVLINAADDKTGSLARV